MASKGQEQPISATGASRERGLISHIPLPISCCLAAINIPPKHQRLMKLQETLTIGQGLVYDVLKDAWCPAPSLPPHNSDFTNFTMAGKRNLRTYFKIRSFLQLTLELCSFLRFLMSDALD